MSTIFLISHVIGFVILVILGLTVIIRNSKSATNIIFTVFVLEFLIYLIFNYLSLVPNQPVEKVLLWIRLVMAVTSFTGPTMFLLAYVFPRQVLTLSLKWVALLGLTGLLSASASLSPYLFTEIAAYTPNNVPLPAPGPLIIIYFISVPVLWLASFIVLIRKYKQSAGTEKTQLAYFLSGIAVNLSYLILFGIVAVNIFATSIFIPFMPLSFVALAAFIAYAITKHHFLDIQPIIARAVSFIFLTIILIAIYTGVLILGVRLVANAPINIGATLIVVLAAIFVTFSFQPLHAFTRKLTDKIFFKGLYNPQEILSQLSYIMSENIKLDNLTNETMKTLINDMRITKAAFAILNKSGISSIKEIGYSNLHSSKPQLDDFINARFSNDFRPLIFVDLPDDAARNFFRQYDVEVIVPVLSENEPIAVLLLGPKSSGNIYSGQDLKIIKALASEAGVAIKNSLLYEDLKIASESKSRFISVVSHQLRTPISSIRWSLEMAKKAKVKIENKQNFLGNALQSTVFLGEQLDDILTTLDIYDRKILVKKALCKISAILKEVKTEFNGVIRDKKLKIHYDVDHGADEVSADSEKLKKIFKVLIKNAISYSKPNGKIFVTAHLEALKNNRRAIISVNDHGMGITDFEREHIFEEFYRSDQARIALPNGLGLGMFIARSFVRAHGGDIWFYSGGRDKGSDFHFSLPIERA